jgi:N-acetylneuraminic acid mutarotase
MATEQCAPKSVLLPNGKVLVAGGTGSFSAERYDPETGIWSAAGSMSTARAGTAMALLPNGKVLVVGGHDVSGVNLSSAELYTP